MSAAAVHIDDNELPSSEPEEAGRVSGPELQSLSSPLEPGADELRRRGSAESKRWTLAVPAKLSRKVRCRKAISGLIKCATSGSDVLRRLPKEHREWLLDNVRLLHSTLNEVIESRLRPFSFPQLQGVDGKVRCRVEVIAESFWSATDFNFDPETLSAWLDGWQQHLALDMGELWALKSALLMAVLEELALATAPLLQKLEPDLLVVSLPERVGIPRLITALRDVGEAEWNVLIEQFSTVHVILSRDPAACYSRMTKETRSSYVAAVAELAGRSSYGERQVAETALSMALAAANGERGESDISQRELHVGYYLIGAGLPRLRREIGYRPGIKQQLTDFLRRFPNSSYLAGIEILTLLIPCLIIAGLPHLSPIVAAFFFLLIPASQAAVELVNAIVTALVPAHALPKLDFSEGIPDTCKTMVAVPALLLNEPELERLLRGLEIRYLANRNRNLYFALLTDGPDSPYPFDGREALAETCARGIRALNQKYGASGNQPFFLFHRSRTFNPSQNTWMGWERKRGKLLDLTRLLSGCQDRFSVKAGGLSVLPQIRYVITLDADTQLPKDAAHRLVGTLAHPLNRAVIDPTTNIVTQGYGILQPRVGISVQSAGRSRLASICSGQTGFDIYTRAVSDVYQDLYGEGIFAGKGIFDVRVFHQILNDRFPCNTLLSHDLIEGAYARAGLATDIEVIEDYPSHFSAYSRRKHRWVRGDWQISQWLFPRVPDYRGNSVPNPISVVSRWKIFDNLRRSLVDPALLGLLIAGWFFLPGGPLYWTAVAVSLLVLPSYVHALLALLRIANPRDLPASLSAIIVDLARGHLNALVSLTFLPHQALVMMDAIVRSIIRYRITGMRLLEWETAAEAESGKTRGRPADTYLTWTPVLALGLALALALARPQSCLIALPFLLVWAGAPTIARWLSREKVAPGVILTAGQTRFLRGSALLIWRYFQENSGPAENWLIPDNVRDCADGAAHSVSPTNLGLLLNARSAACCMGYMTLPEFVESTGRTFATIARLPQHRGHFFNWYDTLTLRALEPLVVSTVDSGNLAASFWTLKQSCLSLSQEPVFATALWHGLQDYVATLRELDREGTRELYSVTHKLGTDGWSWFTGLDAVERATQPLVTASSEPVRRWAAALLERIGAVRELIETLAPWLTCTDETEVRDLIGDSRVCFEKLTLGQVSLLADLFRCRLKSPRFDQLNDRMLRSAVTAENLESELRRIAAQADQMVTQMDFSFLYDKSKKLLSVGYDAATHQLDGARYGLLATEARTAAFIAIAKGDIPQESWFHLGRTQTRSFGRRILLSWTGTMFEYLMPALWMRHYPRTILEQSARAVVEIQTAHARKMHIPWGVSESAYSVTDANGFYQYRAFGLPDLAMRRVRTRSRVIAPYAAFLALAMHPTAAIRNLQRMHKRGWWGRYGPYEAIDFNEQGNPAVVRCWMAHHHGMSLMAIANCVCESTFQRLFHAEPQVMATELLLHEKVPVGVRVRSEPCCEPAASSITTSSAACQPV